MISSTEQQIILLAPWARIVSTQQNPKNYPYWDDVVKQLRGNGLEVWQISVAGEPDVQGTTKRLNDLRLKEIERLLHMCETWVSVDSFLPHLAWSVGKPGVVVFSQSDPAIFGHPENINLLKDRKYLREKQYWLWSQCEYNQESFIGSRDVAYATLKLINKI